MSELEHYINSYFAISNAEDLKSVVSLFQHTTLKKGDFLLKRGKSCDKLSFVQSGFLRMYLTNEDKEITQWISSKGYFAVDLSSFIFETHSKFSIQALVETEIHWICRDDYKKINAMVPLWYELEKMFLIRCFTFIEERIMSHLSMTAEERYHFFFENNKELFNQVPLHYIASMLGMTPETFSRIRKKPLS